MKTVRLTMAQALVRYLTAQSTVVDRREVPLFAGVFAIFGHGNVTCLARRWRRSRTSSRPGAGKRAVDGARGGRLAKAKKRRQIMIAAASIGPGATNMVTAAAVALANRLPILLLAGDTFANRIPDPVLQQVEHFGNPTTTVNDAFKPVTRYWDRITRPEQIISSLPQAVATMLDPGDCGPAFIGARAGRAGRGLRLSGRVLRDEGASHAAAAARRRRVARGGQAPAQGQEAADHRRRRRALFARHRGAGGLRREAQRPRRRDDQRPRRAAARASERMSARSA